MAHKHYYQVQDFRPFLKHPEKYVNRNNKPLVARSGLEIRSFQKLDNLSTVIQWSSENIIVPYDKPLFESNTSNIVKLEQHKYIIDCWLLWKTKDINIEMLVEIKPKSMCYPPKPPKNNNKTALRRYNESIKNYLINIHKWIATQKFCKFITEQKKRPIHFIILTENNNSEIELIHIDKIINTYNEFNDKGKI
jgi:hypothetical protein